MLSQNTGVRIGLVIIIMGAVLTVSGAFWSLKAHANANSIAIERNAVSVQDSIGRIEKNITEIKNDQKKINERIIEYLLK